MSNESNNNLDKLRVSKPAETSAGIKAVVGTMAHIYGAMNPLAGTRVLLELNQKGGIDCASCAWSDPEKRTRAEFCENGAKAMANEGTRKRVGAKFFAEHSVAELAEKEEFWLNKQGRLTEPVVLRKDATHYEPIGWEEAFELIAEELNALASPDEAVFYTSGRTSNEAAFLFQLFVRQFGTNNLPDCSNMCHESTSVALAESIGLGKATVRLEDFERTDLVIVIGQNPGSNAPRMMSSLQDAKRAGAKMIAINPLPEAGLLNFVNPNPEHYASLLKFPFEFLRGAGTHLADLHLPVRIGGDMAVLKGMMKVLVEREERSSSPLLDYEFISSKTSGYEDLIAHLERCSWDDILAESGLSFEQIEEAADMFLNAERVITCWAMGVTQHRHSVATIQDIVNLHLLRGQIGKEGAGLCPVRGHSNVQGDRTMGIWEKMSPIFRKNLEREFKFRTPERDGLNTVESIEAMHDRKAKVFFAMGGNFLSAAPDTGYVAEALKRCRLTVQVLTKLNRTAVVCGEQSLILPCLGRSEIDLQAGVEQFVSTESTMLHVQMSKGVLPPASEMLRSETWIVANLARAVLGEKTTADWIELAGDYDKIREAIARVVPGCENYNERVRQDNGFFLPNPPREREFSTAEGRAQFKSSPLPKTEIGEGQLLMTTIRSHDQFNTTIYDVDDRYRGIKGSRRVIFMNAGDIAERNLKRGQVVDITSHFADGERHAENFIVVPYPIPKGCAATYFPEANPLVPLKSKADRSGTPTSKCVVISLTPRNEFSGRFES